MIFHWPQIVYVVISVLGLSCTALTEPKTGKFIVVLLSYVAMFFVLYFGGFFAGCVV